MENEIKMGDNLLKQIEKLGVNTYKPITLEEFNKFIRDYNNEIMKEELKSLSLKPYTPAPLEHE
jgi:hypothetical protein